MTYSKTWSQFETQSLAFNKLRMELYPEYLVRGYTGQIKIYRPTVDQNNPTLLMTINVQQSFNKNEDHWTLLEKDTYLLVGGGTAHNILNLVKPLLK